MNRRSHLQILGPVDTAFYYVDRPETPMNIGAICIVEGKLDFDDFFKVVESRIFRAPLYQQRVIQAPLNLGQPSWVLDPDFYVGNHVFRVDLPAPGTEEQLRQLAGHLVSGMLDRAKPLWELYQIDGLEGDRTALLFKVHHCMVDGLAAVELFTMLMDMTPDVPPEPRHPIYDPPYLPNSTEMITRAIRSDLPHRWNVLKKIGADVGRLGGVLTDKEKRRQTLVGVANLINDNLSRIKSLPINGDNSGKMTVAWAEFPLAEVKAIKSNAEASINEVMLSVLGGGLDRFFQQENYRGKQEFLRVIVPVTMRAEEEKDDYGNRISVVPIDVPLKAGDSLERLRKVRDYSQVMKHSSLSVGLDLVLTLPSLYPSFAQPLIWGVAPAAFKLLGHSWCTNVAGPPIPVYVLGHPMLHAYGYFPLNPSMGLACVILSYNERITMTLIADSAIIPNVTDLRDCLQSAYTSLRQAAKVPEMPLPKDEPPKPPAPTVTPESSKAAEVSAPQPTPVTAEVSAPPSPQASVITEPEPHKAAEILAQEPDPAEAIPVANAAPPSEPAAEVVATPAPEPETAAAPVEAAPTAAPTAVTSESAAEVIAAPAPDDLPTIAAAEANDPPPPLVEPVDPPMDSSADLPAIAPAPAAPVKPVEPVDPPAAPLNDPPVAEVDVDAPPTSAASPTDAPAAEVAQAATPTAEVSAAPVEAANVAEVAVSAPPAVANAESAAVPETTPPAPATNGAQGYTNGKTRATPALFSEAWAQAYQQAINRSAAYRAASLRWEAGQLAFVISASPRHGLDAPTAVLLDLYHGECRAAHNTPVEAATRRAEYVIEGEYEAWIKVLGGEADPVKMLMRGSLRLSKGSIIKLLPFTQSAQELVHSAQNIC